MVPRQHDLEFLSCGGLMGASTKGKFGELQWSTPPFPKISPFFIVQKLLIENPDKIYFQLYFNVMEGPSTQTALNIKAEENPTLNDLDEADVDFALQHPNDNTFQQKIIEDQVPLTLTNGISITDLREQKRCSHGHPQPSPHY
jgi:hypothetical protein